MTNFYNITCTTYKTQTNLAKLIIYLKTAKMRNLIRLKCVLVSPTISLFDNRSPLV